MNTIHHSFTIFKLWIYKYFLYIFPVLLFISGIYLILKVRKLRTSYKKYLYLLLIIFILGTISLYHPNTRYNIQSPLIYTEIKKKQENQDYQQYQKIKDEIQSTVPKNFKNNKTIDLWGKKKKQKIQSIQQKDYRESLLEDVSKKVNHLKFGKQIGNFLFNK